MMCPFCNHNETKVVDSRESGDYPMIRRRRECLGCEKRFTTYEKIEEPELIVIKKDGRREKFKRDKIIEGLKKACKKGELTTEDIEKLVISVETRIKENGGMEVKSVVLGKTILKELKKRDKMAYLRFASVYEDFENTEDFYKFIGKILKKGDYNETTR